jgi:hypothetical protein
MPAASSFSTTIPNVNHGILSATYILYNRHLSPMKCRWYAYCSVLMANGAFRFSDQVVSKNLTRTDGAVSFKRFFRKGGEKRDSWLNVGRDDFSTFMPGKIRR